MLAMKRQAAETWRCRHNAIRAERVRETGMWLVSADVTGSRDEGPVAYGPTSIMNPDAEVVAQVPTMAVGMVVAAIESVATNVVATPAPGQPLDASRTR
jgi:hypothetical protein